LGCRANGATVTAAEKKPTTNASKPENGPRIDAIYLDFQSGDKTRALIMRSFAFDRNRLAGISSLKLAPISHSAAFMSFYLQLRGWPAGEPSGLPHLSQAALVNAINPSTNTIKNF
jgi:hypothetical protein